MFACYIDESGHCGKRFNLEQPVEVVCGVITNLSKLFKTQREHGGLVKLLTNRGIPVTELKASDIYRGRNAWHGIDAVERHSVIEMLLEWAMARNCKFLVCPIDSKTFFDKKENGCSISELLQYPYEAGVMNVILGVERYKSGTPNNKGKTLVVLDEQNSHDVRIMSLLEGDLQFTDGYTGYKGQNRKTPLPRLNEIIDAPFYSRSHLSKMIQIADLVAFIAYRYLLLKVYSSEESYTNELVQIEDWFRKIETYSIPTVNINPPSIDELCTFYREVRPPGWISRKRQTKA